GHRVREGTRGGEGRGVVARVVADRTGHEIVVRISQLDGAARDTGDTQGFAERDGHRGIRGHVGRGASRRYGRDGRRRLVDRRRVAEHRGDPVVRRLVRRGRDRTVAVHV